MAEIPVLEAAPGQGIPTKGRSWFMTMLMTLILLGAGGAGAWYVLVGSQPKQLSDTEKAAAAAKAPPLYIGLDPPFVVNFEAEQLVRFLQVTVQVMSRDQETIDLVRANDPVVRNDLLLLLGNQKYQIISTREGKERLREQALASVRKVVKNAGGRPDRVEAVYFTSFVMQ